MKKNEKISKNLSNAEPALHSRLAPQIVEMLDKGRIACLILIFCLFRHENSGTMGTHGIGAFWPRIAVGYRIKASLNKSKK